MGASPNLGFVHNLKKIIGGSDKSAPTSKCGAIDYDYEYEYRPCGTEYDYDYEYRPCGTEYEYEKSGGIVYP
jgi:hypothetical protein